MHRDIIRGHWQEVKTKIKLQWHEFTDDEITQMKGNYEELREELQKRYGYNKDAAKLQIEQFIDKYKFKDKHK